jgi:hypothetical protein
MGKVNERTNDEDTRVIQTQSSLLPSSSFCLKSVRAIVETSFPLSFALIARQVLIIMLEPQVASKVSCSTESKPASRRGDASDVKDGSRAVRKEVSWGVKSVEVVESTGIAKISSSSTV